MKNSLFFLFSVEEIEPVKDANQIPGDYFEHFILPVLCVSYSMNL